MNNLGHFALACLTASARDTNCARAGFGAVAGHLLADYFADGATSAEDLINKSKLTVAMINFITGASAEDISAAANAADNAVRNNFCMGGQCYDRRFTFADAKKHWQEGNGEPVTDVDINQINLDDATFNKNKDGSYWIETSKKVPDFLIYGSLTGDVDQSGNLTLRRDYYNFDSKDAKDFKTQLRNELTKIGSWVNGPGTPYYIYFSGSRPFDPPLDNKIPYGNSTVRLFDY